MAMRFGRRLLLGGVAVVGCAVACRAGAQTARTASASSAVEALFLSDVHFDVFRDPAKAERLVAAPVEEWDGILGEADAPDQDEAWKGLQAACHEAAIDTPYALLRSSEAAMKANAPHARFALLSGDVLVHNLPCRFRTLFPEKTVGEYEVFTVKLEQFVIASLRRALPGVRLYVALGNNDTACKADYSVDPESAFFSGTREAVLGWLPAGAERRAAMQSYSRMGDYAVTMTRPMRRTRLIVLNDLFQSAKYKGCDGAPNQAATTAQMAWLERELAGAKRRGQRVWVLGHIPAGLDSYSTLNQKKKVCEGEAPVMFLSSERLAEVMGRYAEVIRLGVFGHSHMDEMRLFGGAEDSPGPAGKVAIKMVPAVSPLASFVSRFVVAQVNTQSSRMLDYAVYEGSNITGVNAAWSKAYSFGETYHAAEYSPVALDGLMRGFVTDTTAEATESAAYLRHVVGGEKALFLRALWPKYACVMEHHTAAGYAACACGASEPSK